jgi:hypothetical protein
MKRRILAPRNKGNPSAAKTHLDLKFKTTEHTIRSDWCPRCKQCGLNPIEAITNALRTLSTTHQLPQLPNFSWQF